MSLDRLNEIFDNSFTITSETKISNGVNFGDMLWDFYSEDNTRSSSINPGRYKFDWNIVKRNVGIKIMYDFKVLTYFLIVAPTLFKGKDNKISTIREEIWKTHQVLAEIIAFDRNLIDFIPSSLSIADFNLYQFENVSIFQSQFPVVKRILKYFTNKYIQRHLSKEVTWLSTDVSNLKMQLLPKETFKEIATTPIDDALYSEIVRRITKDIHVFKKAMKIKQHSKTSEFIQNKLQESIVSKITPERYISYLEILQKDEDVAIAKQLRSNSSGELRKKFLNENGISVKEFNDALRRIHAAAIVTILVFTGMRYSEIISLRKNCITKKMDVFILKGTVVKHRSIKAPTNQDEWVAIPIVNDAIDILECLQDITKNSHLVAALRRIYLKQPNKPYSENGLIGIINSYITETQKEGISFKDFNLESKVYKLTSHRFRHSLAQQLVRGRLGIPYLSYHFKHVNTALVAVNKFSDTTLGYGGIGKELRPTAKNYDSVKKELFDQIYSPDAVVAGGENATEFMQRKKEYYQGLMASDNELDDIIEDLKAQAMPFLDVGLGYCGGRKDRILKDGTREPPPCIGQLKCNPVDCGNAVIPKSKLPIWKKVLEDAKLKLDDRGFKYMELELKETIKRAEMVINHFRE